MKEAQARTSRAIARIREYGIETYQSIRWLFADNEDELDELNNRVKRLEESILERDE